MGGRTGRGGGAIGRVVIFKERAGKNKGAQSVSEKE